VFLVFQTEDCGICGERSTETQTSSIKLDNYTAFDDLTLVNGTLRVNFVLRPFFGRHIEFRLCDVTDNDTRNAFACRNSAPLSTGNGTTFFPHKGQQKAEVLLSLPANVTCSRCVIQAILSAGNFKFPYVLI